jgi:hypothetical protein
MITEQKIKETVEAIAGDLRYYKPEMLNLIPQLSNSNVRSCDPFEVWESDEIVKKMIDLGWKDRVIALAIDVSKRLVD